MEKKSFLFVVTLAVATIFLLGATYSGGWWYVDGATASITTDIPQAKTKDFKAILLINYAKNRQCKPEIGLMFLPNGVLGSPIKRTKASSNMVVTVDGKSWSENTVLMQYSDGGGEFTFFAPDDLIAAIKHGSNASVYLSDKLPSFSFTINEAERALSSARRSCGY